MDVVAYPCSDLLVKGAPKILPVKNTPLVYIITKYRLRNKRIFWAHEDTVILYKPLINGSTYFSWKLLLKRRQERPVASFTKEVNQRLAKRPWKTNGHLANRWLTSLVKEAMFAQRVIAVKRWIHQKHISNGLTVIQTLTGNVCFIAVLLYACCVTGFCVCSDNGLAPSWGHVIIWTYKHTVHTITLRNSI